MRDIALLIFFQACWSSSYVAMKFALAEMPLGLVVILRFGIAFFAFALVGGLRHWKFSRRDVLILIAVGLLDFSLSPYFQLRALGLTYATDVAVLVAFEPIITTLLAVWILKERLAWPTIAAFVIGTIGVLIMSDTDLGHNILSTARMAGNGLFFMSLLCEALYSVTSRHTTQRNQPLHVITLMILAGFVGNLVMHGSTLTADNLGHIGWQGWSAVLFLGLACSAIGYGGWTYLSKRLPIKFLTLSLFLQPMMGGALAYALLDEIPGLKTFIGSGVIMISLFFWTWWQVKERREVSWRNIMGAQRRPHGQ